MRLIVTGCRGFVGGSLGRFAACAGHDVLGIARSSQPGDGWTGRYLQADVLHTDLSGIIAEFKPDVVFHGAGTASVGKSLDAPLDDLRAAVMTWANTLESIRRSSVKPVVLFPSSAAVYGNPASLPVAEDALIAPVSPYGFHKAACELIAREYAECYGLNIALCRIFSIFGPLQRRLLVWELFRQFTGPSQEVYLKGTGQETRDYLYIEDVAAALLSIAQIEMHGGAKRQCRIINFASGQETQISELADRLRTLIASDKRIIYEGRTQPGDPINWCGDPAVLQSILPDWRPQPLPLTLANCIIAWQSGITESV
jgi:UDP-glucose 4-epimerase